MKSLIHRFASLKITVVLLVVILVALSAGTIIESGKGAEAAGALVYGAPWFRLLLAVYALNLACSIVDLWPWGRSRIGFVITHGSMLVILGGALTTELAKVEGIMPILEGEQTSVVIDRSGHGTPVVTLPFAVRLDSFEIDYYQGTRRPAQFRSRVTVVDGATTRPAVIQMNQELAHGGYRFFQSSYQQGARDTTILSVSHDPGEPIVFLGYYGLVAGMITVLATRIGARRRAGAPVAAGVAAALGLFLLSASPARAQWIPPAADIEAVRAMPVQHDGRVMPFDTVARSALFLATGQHSLWGWDPVGVALGWGFDPVGWAQQPIIPVGDRAFAAQLGLASRWASFAELSQNQRFAEIAQEARAAEARERPLTPAQKAAEKLEGRMVVLQEFFERSVFTVIPAAQPGQPWQLPSPLRTVADLRAAAPSSAATVSAAAMQREVAYNEARPSRVAWWVLTLSLVLSIVAWNVPRRGLDLAAGLTLFAGVLVMSWGIGTRWVIASRIPASNMYESLLFLAWGVGAFAVIAALLLRNRIVVLNAAAMSALTMALTDLLPIDPFIHPMPPVLSGTYWLAVHVPIIMVSYSVLALGVVVAHMQIGFSIFAPQRRDLVMKMADLQYWYMFIGAILLIAGILTGSMWASESWGRYWGWDPKEVWSLVAFLAYMAIIHAKVERLIGPFGVAAWSIVAFQTILMTYLGVNFVLSAGLHSYGFGESNVVNGMMAVALAEAAFLFAGWSRRRPPAVVPAE